MTCQQARPAPSIANRSRQPPRRTSVAAPSARARPTKTAPDSSPASAATASASRQLQRSRWSTRLCARSYGSLPYHPAQTPGLSAFLSSLSEDEYEHQPTEAEEEKVARAKSSLAAPAPYAFAERVCGTCLLAHSRQLLALSDAVRRKSLSIRRQKRRQGLQPGSMFACDGTPLSWPAGAVLGAEERLRRVPRPLLEEEGEPAGLRRIQHCISAGATDHLPVHERARPARHCVPQERRHPLARGASAQLVVCRDATQDVHQSEIHRIEITVRLFHSFRGTFPLWKVKFDEVCACRSRCPR